MNKYLKSASDRFNEIKKGDYIINPISEIDSEIIIEFSELFKKLGLKEICTIISQYKYLKDEEIRDLLIESNINVSKKIDSEVDSLSKLIEGDKNKKKFLVIGDNKILSDLIFGYTTNTEYSVDDSFLGEIILNPCDIDVSKKPLYANYKLPFYNEDKFEEYKQLLDSALKQSGVEFIDNNIEEDEK